MRFLEDVPTYWDNIKSGKAAIKDAKDLWNNGNPLAGWSKDGEQTYFKKPFGIIAVALAFNMGYVMLVLGTVQKWIEKALEWFGIAFIRIIRLLFGVVILVLVSPIFIVTMTINRHTGINTKFGNKLVKENDEKNSDKA